MKPLIQFLMAGTLACAPAGAVFCAEGTDAPTAEIHRGILIAQAGSVGGTIGRGSRDLSGGAVKPREEPRAKPPRPRSEGVSQARKPPSGGSCSGVAGTWSSWAAGLFGKGDTRFSAGGVMTHSSGFKGWWRCNNGVISVKWNHDRNIYQLRKSPDGRQLVNPDGSPGFKR
ncbi:MAG: hypothetical protein A2286_00510 [Gammaproteobacteria bacterium RIFOXYA12_FULL_61_12]|nr:MAG: hypothetical protein A2286_00510 [Gammaproteobacteria bacterium RIFOXYA12_FULL_61_12]